MMPSWSKTDVQGFVASALAPLAQAEPATIHRLAGSSAITPMASSTAFTDDGLRCAPKRQDSPRRSWLSGRVLRVRCCRRRPSPGVGLSCPPRQDTSASDCSLRGGKAVGKEKDVGKFLWAPSIWWKKKENLHWWRGAAQARPSAWASSTPSQTIPVGRPICTARS